MNIKKTPRQAGGFSALLLAASTLPAVLFASSAAVAASHAEPITIVITGTRTAQTVDESLAPVTVITRDEIESHPGATVSDVLVSTPGLNITNNGGVGTGQSIFMRGTESDHVLILLDGLRIGSATSGTASIANIPLSQIDRIEIVRGPRSSLYGSEAIGGVIQLFTRTPKQGNNASLALSAGSHSTTGLEMGFSGRNTIGWMRMNYVNLETDGFDACRAESASNFGGCFADEPDADGFQSDSLAISGGVQINPDLSASLTALHSRSELDFDGSFQNQSESIDQLLSGKLQWQASDKLAVSFTAGVSSDHSDNFKDGVFASRFNSDREQLSLQNDLRIGDNGTLTLGADYIKDDVTGTTEYVISSRDNTGLFAQYLNSFGATDLQLSLRSDDNEQFGKESTGGVSLGHDLNDQWRLTASWGSAFKAPTFNELYFPGFGNADLNAETSQSIDLGIAGKLGNTRIKANIFETNIDNLISFDAAANKPINVGEAKISGIELSLGRQIAGWDANLGITVQKPENRGAGDTFGNTLARRTENLANLKLSRSWDKFSLGIAVHAQGHSFDDLRNTKRLDGFTKVDVSLGYALSKNWSLDLAINNLFDESYETAQFFNQDGLNGMLKVRYTSE